MVSNYVRKLCAELGATFDIVKPAPNKGLASVAMLHTRTKEGVSKKKEERKRKGEKRKKGGEEIEEGEHFFQLATIWPEKFEHRFGFQPRRWLLLVWF